HWFPKTFCKIPGNWARYSGYKARSVGSCRILIAPFWVLADSVNPAETAPARISKTETRPRDKRSDFRQKIRAKMRAGSSSNGALYVRIVSAIKTAAKPSCHQVVRCLNKSARLKIHNNSARCASYPVVP